MRKAKSGGLSALDFGILTDKLLLLSGEVTQRIELVEDPVVADFRRFMQAHALPAALPAIGSGGENGGKRGAEVLLEAIEADDSPAPGVTAGDRARAWAPAGLDQAPIEPDRADLRAGDLRAPVGDVQGLGNQEGSGRGH